MKAVFWLVAASVLILLVVGFALAGHPAFLVAIAVLVGIILIATFVKLVRREREHRDEHPH